jgi:tripartite-type tricarboxylate transporter receptor subunit TctC
MIAVTLTTLTCSSFSALAQTSPTRPIRVLVTYAPGASTDINARAMAAKMGENMKQQIIVDNRPGASGMLATALLAKSAPDGHTLMVVDSAHGANPAIYDNMPYDTLKDIDSIGMIARLPMVLLVTPSLPVKSVKDLVAYAKANPGKLNYGSAGTGSAMFLVAELFKSAANIEVMQIAYKGGGPAMVDLAGGQIPMLFISVLAGMPLAQSGRARALGVSSAARVASYPDLPTIAESGVPGVDFYLWQAMLAPAGVSRATLAQLNGELNKALGNAEVKERMMQQGNELMGGTPQQATAFISAEMARWRKIIKPEMRITR